MENKVFFKDNKKINFNETRFKPSLIIRDMSNDFAAQNLETLNRYGIAEIIEFKSSQISSRGNSVKVIAESVEFEKQLLENKRIKIGFVSYRVDKYIKPPTQWYNCKKFGHIANKCPNKTICSKCAGEHKHDSCSSMLLKCVNCGNNHSSFDRNCESFKDAKRVLIRNTNGGKSEGNNKRTLSSMMDQNDMNRRFDKLDDHFEKLEGLIGKSAETFLEFKEEIEHEISRLTVSNNKRLAIYMVESIKIMSTNKFAVDRNVEKKLIECFESHCLADEMPLYSNYDDVDIKKNTKYYANKKNIFIAAKPKCL